MIEADDLKREFKKIRDTAFGKKANIAQGSAMIQQLQGAIIEDISKCGDQHTRQILRMLRNFMMEFERDASAKTP